MESLKKKKESWRGPVNTNGKELSESYYNNKYERSYPVKNLMPLYYQVISLINSIAYRSKKDFRILDIGCGMGDLAVILKKYNYDNYRGFDLSSSGIETAKRNAPEFSEHFFQHNCYELKKIRFDYDVALAIEVLEHIDDLKLVSQLSSGKFFIASLPNYWASNNEHMRIYPSKLYIWFRFFRYLKIISWSKYYLTDKRKIFTFVAKKR